MPKTPTPPIDNTPDPPQDQANTPEETTPVENGVDTAATEETNTEEQAQEVSTTEEQVPTEQASEETNTEEQAPEEQASGEQTAEETNTEDTGSEPKPDEADMVDETNLDQLAALEDFDEVLANLEEWAANGRTPTSENAEMLVDAINELVFFPDLQTTLSMWVSRMESPSGATSPVGILREFCQYARRA